MRAAFRARDRVHLVQDHRLDPTEVLARLGGEQEEERLGGRDEDVGRRAEHAPALVGRRVPGPHGDGELRAQPGERAPQVPLDVVVERLERGDVEQPQPLPRRAVQPVDADEEGRERLPRAGRRLDEHMPAAGDRRPAELLRRGRRRERALEPLPRRGREHVERPHADRGYPHGSYARPVRYDVVVVGGGTAGCVLAARLSENPDRQVCLVEAGPDYGPVEAGRWPPEILDPGSLPQTHSWGTGGEDDRSFGGRILGGSSAVNACMVIAGSPADYAEWGHGWSYDDLRPFLERAAATLRAATANSESPTRFQAAFLEAAEAAGFPRLADPNDAGAPVGVAPFPANVAEGRRWNAAFAYLENARGRRNLTIRAETLVDRVELTGRMATGVACADGQTIEAAVVILAAGAYFSPAILLRSGIGPEDELGRLGIEAVETLPVGERLLDHYGTDVVRDLAPALQRITAEDAKAGGLREAHAFVEVRERELRGRKLGPAPPALDLPHRRGRRVHGRV